MEIDRQESGGCLRLLIDEQKSFSPAVDEALHDIVILACDVEQAAGRLEAYGMAESS